MSTIQQDLNLTVGTTNLKDASTTSVAEVSPSPSPVERFHHTENQLNMIAENAKYAEKYQETYKDGHLPLPPSKQYLVLTCTFLFLFVPFFTISAEPRLSRVLCELTHLPWLGRRLKLSDPYEKLGSSNFRQGTNVATSP